ncbi:hypothetical protein [Catellatospora sp. NPDC049609]|uniref:hypothetical protein n=1 Tax=Catellatospora sp. NPDC049609 TaxID=3155505 RepID=UPI0034217E6A
MFWWRRRKAAAGKWIVVVSTVRPLDPNGGGRDELRWPEQRSAEHTADSRDAADDIAGRLIAETGVQQGRDRVKVLFTGH